MNTNPLPKIKKTVLNRFPKATCVIDPSETPTGSSFLDIWLDNHFLVVEWNFRGDIGISSTPEYYEGPELVFSNQVEAQERILKLLLFEEA